MKRVVPSGGVEVGPLLQYGKLLLHILVDGQDNGDGRHQYIADKRLDQVGEGGRETAMSARITHDNISHDVHETKGNLQNVSLKGKVDKSIPEALDLSLAPIQERVGLAGAALLVGKRTGHGAVVWFGACWSSKGPQQRGART